MGAKSKHIEDIAIWIGDVIDSCENLKHENTARSLVQNFEKLLMRINREDDFYVDVCLLRRRLDEKYYDYMAERFKNQELLFV